MKTYLLILIVLGCSILAYTDKTASAAAMSEEALLKAAVEARQRLMNQGDQQEYRPKWLAVIERYERVLKNYPTGQGAEAALSAMAELYIGLYQRSRLEADLEEALALYRRLTKSFPQGAAAAKAQVQIGRIYLQHGNDPDRAFFELLKVELNHPSSREQVIEARKLMAEITQAGNGPGPDKPRPVSYSTPAAQKPTPSTVAGPGSELLVTDLKYWHNPTYSRVAVYLSQPVKFSDHFLKKDEKQGKPMRVYLDLENARIGPGVRDLQTFDDGLLKRARAAQFDAKTVRVVIDLLEASNYRVFSLNDPFRIVVDVTSEKIPFEGEKSASLVPTPPSSPVEVSGPLPTPTVKPTPETGVDQEDEGEDEDPAEPLADLRSTAKKRKKLPRGPARGDLDGSSLARQLGLKVKKIVIDPGHGGKDVGAVGVSGLKEKDLTLDVARLLARKIERQLGLKVVLTRDKDVFLPLEERTAVANTKGADLFISIHANAHQGAHINGPETYFLNVTTDEEAMRVAARENATSSKNMSDLQMILSDLMLNSKIAESGRLAGKVHRAMAAGMKKQYKGLRDLGIKQAPFYVLIGANMPSILIEVGFLSNAAEESRLKNPRYIEALTDGIVEGLKAYSEAIKKAG